MEYIKGQKRKQLLDLFKSVPYGKAFIYSAIENDYEHMFTDNIENPTTAVLFYGGLVIYAGEPNKEIAEEIIKQFEIQPVIIAYSTFWNRILEKVYGNKLKQDTRYYLPFSSHNRSITRDIYSKSKSGIRSITELDLDFLKKKYSWEHQDHHYMNHKDFVNSGLGFVYEEGHIIKSAASAYCRSSKHAECQVNTTDLYCRNGFATIVSSAFIEQCYNSDLEIPWDAANDVSVKLGKKLGYSKVEPYKTYSIFPN